MTLHLYTGRATAGKTEYVYTPLREAAAAGSSPILLLPTRPDVHRASEEFARKAVVGVQISTFDEWVEALWMRFGDGRRLMLSTTREILVRRALRECADGADAVEATRGYAALVASVVQRRSVVSEVAPAEASARRILAIADAYDRIAEQAGLIEPVRATLLLADSGLGLLGPLGFNRFTDLSVPQERLLLAASETQDVFGALTWERGLPATEATDGLVSRLEAAGARLTELPAPEPEDGPGVVEPCLFAAQPTGALSPTSAVRFGVAAGEEAEVSLVARTVAELVAEGYEPESIAVVFPDPSRRADALEAALAAEGIPFAVDVALRMSDVPLGRALIGLVEVAASSAPSTAHRVKALSFLSSPYAGAKAELVRRLDGSWRRARQLDPRRILGDARQLGGAAAAAIDAAIAAVRPGLDVKSAQNWKSLADTLLATAASSSGGTPARSDLLDAAAHRAVLRAVSEALETPDARIGGNELVSALGALPVSAAPLGERGAVQLTELSRLRSRRFDAIVVGGMTASEYSALKEPGITERMVVAAGERPRADALAAQRLEFYLLATRARRRLVLIRRSEDGEAERPSACWDELAGLFAVPGDDGAPAIPAEMQLKPLALADLEAAAPAFSAGRCSVRSQAAGIDSPVPLMEVGCLDADDLIDSLARRTVFSVTELEAYHACPYRWFFDRFIRPSDMDREVGARERGSLGHAMLQRFYRHWQEAGHERVTPTTLDDALAVMRVVAGEVEGELSPPPATVAEELSLASVRDLAAGIVAQDAELLPDFVPTYAEWAFGGSAERAALRIGDASLVGRIDRIDIGPQGVVVTDYKLGEVKGLSSFESQGLLQVPLYALVASRELGMPIAGGAYRSLKTRDIRGFFVDDVAARVPGVNSKDIVSQEECAAVVARAISAAEEAIAGIRQGRIAPDRRVDGACAWCGAAAVCPRAEVSAWS